MLVYQRVHPHFSGPSINFTLESVAEPRQQSAGNCLLDLLGITSNSQQQEQPALGLRAHASTQTQLRRRHLGKQGNVDSVVFNLIGPVENGVVEEIEPNQYIFSKQEIRKSLSLKDLVQYPQLGHLDSNLSPLDPIIPSTECIPHLGAPVFWRACRWPQTQLLLMARWWMIGILHASVVGPKKHKLLPQKTHKVLKCPKVWVPKY